MAERFNLTAQLQLQAPTNTQQVVGQIRRQLQGINVNVAVKGNVKQVASINKELQNVNKAAKNSAKSVSNLNRTLADSARRFSVITVATGSFLSLARAIKNSVGSAVEFQREMVKISQVTGQSLQQLEGISKEVTTLSTQLGVANRALLETSRVLAQAGFNARQVRESLDILAKTTLAPTFDNIKDTTEGAIALLRQFGKEATRMGTEIQFLEQSLDAINAVSKRFAVESSDLITAVRRTGGVFEAAGGNINELISLFTSVRSTTRESAETIATGFRTIFTRLQRTETIDQLRELGITLQDTEGKFIGPLAAVEALSVGLAGLDPKDFRFNQIVEQLGGFRQIGKVIPLIKEFATTQNALNVALSSGGSVAQDAETAQQALAVQFEKVGQQFDALIRKFAASEGFGRLAKFAIDAANAFLKFAEVLEDLLPQLAALAAIRIGRGIAPGVGALLGGRGARRNSGGMVHGFARGGMVPGQGNYDTVPAMLTPGEFVIKKSSVKSLGADTLARMNNNRYTDAGKVAKDNTALGKLRQGKEISLAPSKLGNFKKALLRKAEKGGDGDTELDIGGAFLQPEGVVQSLRSEIQGTEILKAAKDAVGASNIDEAKAFLNAARTRAGQFSIPMSIKSGSLSEDISSRFRAGIQTSLSKFSNDFAGQNMPGVKFRGSKFRKAFQVSNREQIEGGIFESFINGLSDKPFDNQKINPNDVFDFRGGLGSASKAFNGLGPDLVTDAKRTFSTDALASLTKKGGNLILENITGQLAKSLLDQGPSKKDSVQKRREKLAAGDRLAANRTKKASGGGISGSDTVPALLTPGEFVFNKSAAQSIGYSNLSKMNQRGVQGFAAGGVVEGGRNNYGLLPPGVGNINQLPGGGRTILQKENKTAAKNIKKLGLEALKAAKETDQETRSRDKSQKEIDEEATARDRNTSRQQRASGLSNNLNKMSGVVGGVSSTLLTLSFAAGPLIQSMGGLTDAQKQQTQAFISTFAVYASLGTTLVQMAASGASAVASSIANTTAKTKEAITTELNTTEDIKNTASTKINSSAKDENTLKTKTNSNAQGVAGKGAMAANAAMIALTGAVIAYALIQAKIAAEQQKFKTAIQTANSNAEKFLQDFEKTGQIDEGAFVTARTDAALASLQSNALSASSGMMSFTGAAITGASAIGGAIAGFKLGAMGGTAITPGVGTAIGAVVGALVGLGVAFFVSSRQIAGINEQIQEAGKPVIEAAAQRAQAELVAIKALYDFDESLRQAQASGLNASQTLQVLATGVNNLQAAYNTATNDLAESTERTAKGLQKLVDAGLANATGGAGEATQGLDDAAKAQIKEVIAGFAEIERQISATEARVDQLRQKALQQESRARQQTIAATGEAINTAIKAGDFSKIGDILNKAEGELALGLSTTASIIEFENNARVGALKQLRANLTAAGGGELSSENRQNLDNLATKEAERAVLRQAEAALALEIAANKQAQAALKSELTIIREEQARRALLDVISQNDAALKGFNNFLFAVSGTLAAMESIDPRIAIGNFEVPKLKLNDTAVFDIPLQQIDGDILNKNLDAAIGLITSNPNTTNVTDDLFTDVGKTVKDAKAALDVIPQELGTLVGSLGENVPNTADLLDNLLTAAGLDRTSPITDILETQLQALVGDGGTFDSEALENFQSALNDVAGAGLETAKKIFEVQNKYLESLDRINAGIVDAQTRLQEAQANVIDVRERGRDRVAEATGIPRDRRARQRGRLDAARARVGAEARGGGVRVGDVAATGKALKDLTREARALDLQQRTNGTLTEAEIARRHTLNKAMQEANSELERMADQSSRAADVMSDIEEQRKIIDEERAKREQGRGLVEDFVAGDAQARSDINRTLNNIGAAIAQGNLAGSTADQRQEILGMLDQLSDVEIRGSGGLTGSELKDVLVRAEAARIGVDPALLSAIYDGTTKEQDALNKIADNTAELRNIGAQEEAAAQALADAAEVNVTALEVVRDYIVDHFAEDVADALNKASKEQAAEAAERGASDKDLADTADSVQTELDGIDKTLANLEPQLKTTRERLAGLNPEIQRLNSELSSEAAKAAGDRIRSLNETLEDSAEAAKRAAEAEKERLEAMNNPAGMEFVGEGAAAGMFTLAQGGMIYKAAGGSIFKPKGTDTVPAMLTPGEFVIKKSSVDKIGAATLHQLNNGNVGAVQGFAGGGRVAYLEDGGEAISGETPRIARKNARYKRVLEAVSSRNAADEQEVMKIVGQRLGGAVPSPKGTDAANDFSKIIKNEIGDARNYFQILLTQIANREAEAQKQEAEAAAAGAAAVQANLAVSPAQISQRFSFLPANLQDDLIDNVFGLNTGFLSVNGRSMYGDNAIERAKILGQNEVKAERKALKGWDKMQNDGKWEIERDTLQEIISRYNGAQKVKFFQDVSGPLDAGLQALLLMGGGGGGAAPAAPPGGFAMDPNQLNDQLINNPKYKYSPADSKAKILEQLQKDVDSGILNARTKEKFIRTGIPQAYLQQTSPELNNMIQGFIAAARNQTQQFFIDSLAMPNNQDGDAARKRLIQAYLGQGNVQFPRLGMPGVIGVNTQAGPVPVRVLPPDFGVRYFQSGGSVEDTVPAMLTPGEFVMNKSAVQKHGVGFMKNLNRGKVPGFNRGGIVGHGNVAYKQNGGSIEGNNGVLQLDPSLVDNVLKSFSATFKGHLDGLTTQISGLSSAISALQYSFSNMHMTHNFQGDMTLAFSITNSEELKSVIGAAIAPKIGELIALNLDNRLGSFNATGSDNGTIS